MISPQSFFLQIQRQQILHQKENLARFLKMKYVSWVNLETSLNSLSRKIIISWVAVFYLFILFYTLIFGYVWYIWSKACTAWADPGTCYEEKTFDYIGFVPRTNPDPIAKCESLCIYQARTTLFDTVKQGCCLVVKQLPQGFHCAWSAGGIAFEFINDKSIAKNCTRISEFYLILSIQLKGFIKYIMEMSFYLQHCFS